MNAKDQKEDKKEKDNSSQVSLYFEEYSKSDLKTLSTMTKIRSKSYIPWKALFANYSALAE